MPSAKVAVVMISEAFFQSKPCVAELQAVLKWGIPLVPVVFDVTARGCMKGNFLGEDMEMIKQKNSIKVKMDGNWLPPPDRGIFQDDFHSNAQNLVKLVKELLAKASSVPA